MSKSFQLINNYFLFFLFFWVAASGNLGNLGIIYNVNESFCNIIGMSKENLIGRNCNCFMPKIFSEIHDCDSLVY